MALRAVHIGSQSIDAEDNTQVAIDAIVISLVTAIPNLSHIAIGTYFDYDSTHANDQFNRWATAIHGAGKKLYVRSAGHNDWLGSNGVTKYTSADWEAHCLSQIQTWIDNNYSIFQAGDVFEPFPDEPENNSLWVSTYTTISSGAGETAFNNFITTAISNANSKFTTYGVTGVDTGVTWTNPSAAKDAVTTATAATLTSVGMDSYPESGLTTPAEMETAMQTQMNTYGNPHAGRNSSVTFGPSVYTQMSEADQADALGREFDVIVNTVTKLHGITIWQFGATDNGPKSRLFDYAGGAWTARSAASTVNTKFGTILGRLSTVRGSAASRGAAASRDAAASRSGI